MTRPGTGSVRARRWRWSVWRWSWCGDGRCICRVVRQWLAVVKCLAQSPKLHNADFIGMSSRLSGQIFSGGCSCVNWVLGVLEFVLSFHSELAGSTSCEVVLEPTSRSSGKQPQLDDLKVFKPTDLHQLSQLSPPHKEPKEHSVLVSIFPGCLTLREQMLPKKHPSPVESSPGPRQDEEQISHAGKRTSHKV